MGLLPPGRDGCSVPVPPSLIDEGGKWDSWLLQGGGRSSGSADATLAGKDKGSSLMLLRGPPLASCAGGFIAQGSGQTQNLHQAPLILPQWGKEGKPLYPREANTPGSPKHHPNRGMQNLARIKV